MLAPTPSAKRENRGRCKPGALPQRAQAEAEIAQQLVETRPAAFQVEALLRRAHAAELTPRAPVRFVFAQALAPQFVGFEFEMRFDFLGKILCTAFALEHVYASSPCGSLPESRINPIARVSASTRWSFPQAARGPWR